jgi:hypothetical protein
MSDAPAKATAHHIARLVGGQPVGGEPGVHARRLGQQGDGGQAARRPSSWAPAPTPSRAVITGRKLIIGLVMADLENQFHPMAPERLGRASLGARHPGGQLQPRAG